MRQSRERFKLDYPLYFVCLLSQRRGGIELVISVSTIRAFRRLITMSGRIPEVFGCFIVRLYVVASFSVFMIGRSSARRGVVSADASLYASLCCNTDSQSSS